MGWERDWRNLTGRSWVFYGRVRDTSRPWGVCAKHSQLSFGKLSPTVFRGMAKREAELGAGSLIQGVLREQ